MSNDTIPLRSKTDTISKPEIKLTDNQIKILNGAKECLKKGFSYDLSMAYYNIEYPMGDIDPNIGVCTDVIIRALRYTNIVDLQEAINKDIKLNWNNYPRKRWNSKKPDTNIDHRRVMNLEVWFAKYWQKLNNDIDFQPGDIIVWDMDQDNYSDHIGIISDSFGNGRYYVIHNHPNPGYIANEDKLFRWKISGHYRINIVLDKTF